MSLLEDKIKSEIEDIFVCESIIINNFRTFKLKTTQITFKELEQLKDKLGITGDIIVVPCGENSIIIIFDNY